MSSIQKIQRKKGMTYKAVLKSGQQVLKTKTFSKQSLAKQWLKHQSASIEAISAFGLCGARMKLTCLIDEFTKQYKGKDVSLIGKLEYWRRAMGDKYLLDISTNDIRIQLKDFASGKSLRSNGCRSKQKIKLVESDTKRRPSTVNRMKAALSSLFKYAIQEGLVENNPVKGIPNKPENNKRVRYLSDSECERLLEAARKSKWSRLYTLIILAITTGARKGELINLK